MPEYFTVRSITNHGTIVALHLEGRSPVYFDHRPFGWLWEERQGNVVGCRVQVVDVEEGAESVVFEDEVEEAA